MLRQRSPECLRAQAADLEDNYPGVPVVAGLAAGYRVIAGELEEGHALPPRLDG